MTLQAGGVGLLRHPDALLMALTLGLTMPSAARAAEAASTTPPTVQIEQPSEWSYVGATCPIRIRAESPSGIQFVGIYVDGRLLETDFTAPYEVAWVTDQELEGPHAITAKAIGENLLEAVTPRRTIVIDHQTPRIRLLAPATQTTVVGLTTVTTEAADHFGIRTVKLLVDGEEAAATAEPPYRFAWDTRLIPNGHHTLEARAINLAGNSATSAAVTVSVANPNSPPALERVGSRTVLEGVPWSLTLTAVDPDGARDPLIVSVTGLPPWATFNAATATISGTPGYEEAARENPLKPYPNIALSVCDPEPLCDDETIAINVMNANRLPAFAPLGDQTVDEDNLLVIKPMPTDPDHDELTCRMESLPAWMRFDPNVCTARGIPNDATAELVEPMTIYEGTRFSVCDPDPGCAEETFKIIVTNVGDQPPVFTMSNAATVKEGDLLSLDITADDPEHDTLVLEALALPEGAAFTDRGDTTGAFSWIPRFDQSGTYTAKFKVSDKTSDVTTDVRIVVQEAALAVSGLVTDTLGAPLKDATIEIQSKENPSVITTTNADGYYLMVLKPGEYQLIPTYTLEGFSTIARKRLDAAFNPPYTRLTITNKDQTGINFAGELVE